MNHIFTHKIGKLNFDCGCIDRFFRRRHEAAQVAVAVAEEPHGDHTQDNPQD